jgi:hypothetical protein
VKIRCPRGEQSSDQGPSPSWDLPSSANRARPSPQQSPARTPHRAPSVRTAGRPLGARAPPSVRRSALAAPAVRRAMASPCATRPWQFFAESAVGGKTSPSARIGFDRPRVDARTAFPWRWSAGPGRPRRRLLSGRLFFKTESIFGEDQPMSGFQVTYFSNEEDGF